MPTADFDLAVVGGGITGAAAARDAAGRGLSVVLLERHDLGSGTTSRSSRMAHGGLRYLERLQLGLVRESLTERNLLFQNAPTLVKRERFRLPVQPDSRPRWMLASGLLFYDLIAGTRDRRREVDGFSYVDGICEPERLAAGLAQEAAGRGAVIRTRTPVATIESGTLLAGDERIRARAVLLCAGPWTDRVLAEWHLSTPQPLLSPTRGTHILLESPIDAPRLLQATSDGRVFFAVPAFGGTLVGTTDLPDDADPSDLRPRPEEISYLLSEIGRRLPQLGNDLRAAWTGLRPLLHSNASAGARSRGELIVEHPRHPSLFIVVGGKLTTMRLMAERAVDRVEKFLGRIPTPWTRTSPIRSPDPRFAVRSLADVLLRRTSAGFGTDQTAIDRLTSEIAVTLRWSPEETARQMEDFRNEAKRCFGLSW